MPALYQSRRRRDSGPAVGRGERGDYPINTAFLGLPKEFISRDLCAQRYGWSPMGMRIDDFHQNISPAFSGKYFFKKDRKNLANSGEAVNKN
jgi:hypothetical protein